MKLYPGLIIFSLCLTGLGACRQHKEMVQQIKNRGLTVMLMKTPGGTEDADQITYSARLVPDKEMISKTDKMNIAMLYHMDSCFYLQQGKEKVYASLTQPIANGVQNSYEYLLSFERKGINDNKWDFVYQDKYLNHQTYKIEIGE